MRSPPESRDHHPSIATLDPRLAPQLDAIAKIRASEHDAAFFEEHEILRVETDEGRWWRETFGGAMLLGQRVELHPSERGQDLRRAVALAPHPVLSSSTLDREGWHETFLVKVTTAMREIVPRRGRVDYVGASFSGHVLPTQDDYALLCFVDHAGSWWGVDPVSVFFLGSRGGDALNRLLLNHPWQDHVAVVGEPWSDRFARR